MRRLFCLLALTTSLVGSAWTLGGTGLQGWQTRDLVIHVNPTGCPISAAVLDDAVDSAITAWNGIATASLTLTRSTTDSTTTAATFLAGTATDAPLILCDTTFGTDLSVDPSGVPAATKLGSSNPLSYGAVILNAQAGTGAEINNFASGVLDLILAHEIGHLLGLGHSSEVDALMYYSIANKTIAVLTQDDRDGITYLYPRNEFEHGAFGCAAVHKPASAGRMFPFVWTLLMIALGFSLVKYYFRPKSEPLL